MKPVRRTATDSRRGSALILAVVLTSLLAIVAVLFVMAARIDRMATSAVSESRELDFALDTILAQINEDLVADVPDANGTQEYYDYPDARNPWLADLEPDKAGGDFRWRQISNVGSMLTGSTRDVRIRVVGEREKIGFSTAETDADADGDGVGDARWFRIPGIMSSKGKPVYAAVRIVDNGAMLNVNTGHKLDETDPDASRVDGSRQLHVNAMVFENPPAGGAALLRARANSRTDSVAWDLARYESEVIWGYLDRRRDPNLPPCPYTPFDVSDELGLRYRYLLKHNDFSTRVEDWGRFRQSTIWTPVDSGGGPLGLWFARAANPLDPNATYAYRHVATTYNMDRILTPRALRDGRRSRRMLNVNRIDNENLLYVLRDTIEDAMTEVQGGFRTGEKATQIAVNLKDYVDPDDEVSVLAGAMQTSEWYGFERPCVYISEIACRLQKDSRTGVLHESYAIELHKPYFEDNDPQREEWYLVTSSGLEQEIIWSGTRRFHVSLAEDSEASLRTGLLRFSDLDPPDALTQYAYDPRWYPKREQNWRGLSFKDGHTIRLVRRVGPSRREVIADMVQVPAGLLREDGEAHSLQRDISPYRCFWCLWGSGSAVSLGNAENNYVSPTPPPVLQAHPANKPMRNIGELGMIFAEYGYYTKNTSATPSDLLVDLTDPLYSRLFNYLTVIDPVDHNLPSDETRVMGRININTAPWFVLAQLPWMQYRYDPNTQTEQGTFDRAMKIADYRNANGAFRSIADLMQVPEMLELRSDTYDNLHSPPALQGPDVTPDDARDDLEERDLIFTRISNLITVRSDVFTAYILVRLGADGPQKRVIAILDRSRVKGPGDKVRVVAEHLVPDPR